MKSLRWFLAAGLLTGTGLAQQPAPNLEQVMKAMGAMLGGSTNAASIVDFRELKALLPAELPGLKRTKAGGEKSGAMGMTVAMAEGDYEGSDDAKLHIKITDMGGTGAMMGFMQYGWAAMEVDKENDNGYERTTTIAGHKAMEKYDGQDKSGEIQIMVNKRFLVEITGRHVTAEALKGAADKLDLAKLAGLSAIP
jgi:hypothetical protein